MLQGAIGTLLLALLGWQIGAVTGALQPRSALVGAAVGAILGLVLSPFLIMLPYERLSRTVASSSPSTVVVWLVGLLSGLLVGLLLAPPLSYLPWSLGHVVPAVVALLCALAGVNLASLHRHTFQSVLRVRETDLVPSHHSANQGYLLDTSAIIDGRIADIAQTGFLIGPLIVPRFILAELQHIAGSADALRRGRGRRGLEILRQLQQDELTTVTIRDLDVRGISEVDDKLVRLARDMSLPVVTNDYNLNRVAELLGVRVLNVNGLANAVKPFVLPGEQIAVRIIQEGKEAHQGVGYLADGTMIVVENARQFLHSDVDITVTRVLQTVAGRMIFAHVRGNGTQ